MIELNRSKKRAVVLVTPRLGEALFSAKRLPLTTI
jgi:hypothetical protein